MAVVPHPTKSKKEPGRWWYIDVGRGKERQRIPYHGTYDEAVRLYQELASSRNQQPKLLPRLSEMVVPFLDYYQQDAAPATWADVRLNMGKHIVPLLGKYRVDQLTQCVLDDFRQHLTATGCSPRTCNKIMSYLAALIRWGRRTGQCGELPGKLPRYPRRKTQAAPRQALTSEQVDAMFAALEPEYRLLYLLMVDHGLRREEAMSLRFEDIDTMHRVISVLGKGNKRRFVPFMSARFEDELAHAMQERQSGPVTINPATGQHYASIRKALLRAAKACNLPPVGHHILRHTFATRMAEAGMPPYVLQQIMGHTSQETTSRVYVHIGNDFAATTARKFRRD